MPNFAVSVLRSTRAAANQLVLKVPTQITKIELRNYLRAVYGMDVMKINTVNVRRRKKRTRFRGVFSQSSAYKKAYVRLSGSDARTWEQLLPQ